MQSSQILREQGSTFNQSPSVSAIPMMTTSSPLSPSKAKVTFASDPSRTTHVLEQVHSIPNISEDLELREELFYQPKDIKRFRKQEQRYRRCFINLLRPISAYDQVQTISTTKTIGKHENEHETQLQSRPSSAVTHSDDIMTSMRQQQQKRRRRMQAGGPVVTQSSTKKCISNKDGLNFFNRRRNRVIAVTSFLLCRQ